MTASYRGTGWVSEITSSSLRLQTNYQALHRHLDNTPQINKGALGNLNRLEWIKLTNTSMNGTLAEELGRLAIWSDIFGVKFSLRVHCSKFWGNGETSITTLVPKPNQWQYLSRVRMTNCKLNAYLILRSNSTAGTYLKMLHGDAQSTKCVAKCNPEEVWSPNVTLHKSARSPIEQFTET